MRTKKIIMAILTLCLVWGLCEGISCVTVSAKTQEEEGIVSAMEASPDFFISQADIVGNDVFLIWSNAFDMNKVDKIQVLRSKAGAKKIKDYKVIGTVGKIDGGIFGYSYRDKGAGKKNYQYALRTVSGKKTGLICDPVKAEKTTCKWYKSADGYIRMGEWDGYSANFIQFDSNFDVVWCADWSYKKTAKNTYKLNMTDSFSGFDGSATVYVTNKAFKLTYQADGMKEPKVTQYKSINNVKISIKPSVNN